MSHVNPIQNGSPPTRFDRVDQLSSTQRAGPVSANGLRRVAEDSVDLSAAARGLDSTAENGTFRTALVDRIRAEIASGAYETSDRLDRALDSLTRDYLD